MDIGNLPKPNQTQETLHLHPSTATKPENQKSQELPQAVSGIDEDDSVAVSLRSDRRRQLGERLTKDKEDHAEEQSHDQIKQETKNKELKNEEKKASDPNALSKEEKKEVENLKERDQEVRQHEQAHLAGLGKYRSGGASFEFETGPDGNSYAVEGEVPVDLSPVAGNPEQTAEKAKTIRRAALAPTEPSTKDRKVAAQATKLIAEAKSDVKKETKEEDLKLLPQSPETVDKINNMLQNLDLSSESFQRNGYNPLDTVG
jgi:hypothetical protein